MASGAVQLWLEIWLVRNGVCYGQCGGDNERAQDCRSEGSCVFRAGRHVLTAFSGWDSRSRLISAPAVSGGSNAGESEPDVFFRRRPALKVAAGATQTGGASDARGPDTRRDLARAPGSGRPAARLRARSVV